MTDQYRREQIAFPNQSRYYKEPRPARQIPTREQLEAAALRQAQYEAADESYSGHSAGIHPENRQFLTDERNPRTRASVSLADNDELEEGKEYYLTRPHTSAVRYDTPASQQIIRQGKKRYVIHDEYPPLRQRRIQPPQAFQEEIIIPKSGRRFNFHPLVWVGLAMLIMLLGYIALSALGNWWQAKQDDWTYGQQRHFEIDAVVGHSDSSSTPSHFIGENNNGDIYVIELPGGDSSKAKIYQITTITGNDGNPPVKLSFQDINRDGKLDLIVQIGEPGNSITVILFNNGQTFISKL